jgi:maltoporin
MKALMLCGILCVGVGGFAGGARAQTSATNSEVQQLRQEMQQLQQDYQRRMQALEERLKRMEAPAVATGTNAAPPLSPSPVVAPAPTLSAAPAESGTNAAAARQAAIERGRAFARQQFEPSEGMLDRNIAPATNTYLQQRVEQVLQDFVDITGYVRAGYGRDNQGGPQPAFQAPGALAKYRLGNEAENYGELAFGKNWYVPGIFSTDPQERPDGTPTGPIAHAQVRFSFYNPYSAYNSGADTQFGLPEAWASIGNVVPSQSSMKFWAGDRFYERSDIHINDFYFRNMSGGGGGVEDIKLPFGQLALAWIGNGGQSDLYTDIPSPDPANRAGFSKGNVDLRLYDVPLPLGKGDFNLIYANADAGLDQNGHSLPRTDGFAVNFLHLAKPLVDANSFNMFSLQYGRGPAKTFTSGFETFSAGGTTYIRPDPDNSWRFRATEHFVVQPIQHFSIGPALVYQYTDYGDGFGNQTWASVGVRPIWEFNKYFSLAFEGGIDYVAEDNVTHSSGNVYKLTLAPQVSLGDQFFSRPVLRLFVTWAHWSDAFVGQVGGQDYQNLQEGLTWGMQMETWW